MNIVDQAAQIADNRNLFFSHLKAYAPTVQFSWGEDIIRQLPQAVQVEAFLQVQPQLLHSTDFIMCVVASFDSEATKWIGAKIGPQKLLQHINNDKHIGVENLNSDVRAYFGFK